MKWMPMVWVVVLSVELTGCVRIRMPWQPPLTPFREGQLDGCADKKSGSTHRPRGVSVVGGSTDAYSRGWAEGYSTCRKEERKWEYQSPYEIEQEQKKNCNEKHRLCFSR